MVVLLPFSRFFRERFARVESLKFSLLCLSLAVGYCSLRVWGNDPRLWSCYGSLCSLALCHELKFSERFAWIFSPIFRQPFHSYEWVVQLYLVTTSSCYAEVIQIFLEACPTLGLLSLLFSVMDCECRVLFRGIYPSFPFAIWSVLFLSFWGNFSPNCRMASSFWEFGVSSISACFLFDFNHFKPLRFCFPLFFLCVKPYLKRFSFSS